MSDSTYAVPGQRTVVTTEVLKSRFVAVLDRIRGRNEMLQLVADCQAGYPGATHYCWAFVAGAPGATALVGQNDDGEPHGTAGEPMLNVLLHTSLGETGVVVVRYFGGTKLGKGGLARAYASAVNAVVAATPGQIQTPIERREGTLGYAEFHRLERILADTGIVIAETHFAARVHFSLDVPLRQLAWLDNQLAGLQGRL